MAHAETARDVAGETAEMLPYALTDRLECLEAGGVAVGMDADALGGKWSTAMNTAAWPWPVIVVVRSVPQIESTVAGMVVRSWLHGPRG